MNYTLFAHTHTKGKVVGRKNNQNVSGTLIKFSKRKQKTLKF